MFPRPTQSPCRLNARRRLALGGLAVTSALVAGAFVSTPAFADTSVTVTTPAELDAALAGSATSIQLGNAIDAVPTDGTVDAETVSSTKTLDLNGNTLSMNQITVGSGAAFNVTDSTATPGVTGTGRMDVSAFEVGSGTGPVTGVSIGDTSSFHVSGAKMYVWGINGGAGIGSDDAAGTARFVADGAADVSAYGDAGGAAVGGSTGNAGIDVTVDAAALFARGGAGAAAVGGGEHGAGGAAHVLDAAVLDAQQGTDDGITTAPASAIGAGQDTTGGFGSLEIGAGTALNMQSDGPVRLTAGATVENAGTIFLVQPAGYSNSAVTGSGTIHNLGSITAQTEDANGNGTSVDPASMMDSTVQVTGNNFDVAIDANGGTYTGTQTGHIESGTLSDLIGEQDSGFTLAAPSAATTFWKWNTAADGTGTDVSAAYGVQGNLTTLRGSADGAPVTVRLFAKYAKVPYATATSLPNGTVGSTYSAALPVAGDGLSAYYVSGGNSSSSVIPGLPAGLSLDASTGLITGTPTEAINRTVTFYVQGVGGADLTYHLTVAPAAVVTAPSAPQGPSAPHAPVMRTIPTRTVKLGHVLTIPLEATGDQPVTYAVTSGSLPKGISLNGSTGLIRGTAAQSGTFAVVVTAKNAAGAFSIPITIVVPAVQDLISTPHTVPAVEAGAAAVPLKVSGLKKGEHWTLKVDGKLVHRGTMKKAGTLSVTVHLKKALRDKVHHITIAGSRKVTDPSTRVSTTVTITSLAARKTLKVSSKAVKGVKQVVVAKLAAHEHVVVKDGSRVIASGHATAAGTFAFPQSKAGKGTSRLTVHGAAAKRAGKLTVKNPGH